MLTFWNCTSLFVLALLILSEYYWIDASVTTQSSQINVWTRRQNSFTNTSNAVWQGPPTTPWPALGTQSQYQPANNQANRSNQNRNFANIKNRNPSFDNSRNVELSYGINQVSQGNTNQNNVRPVQNRTTFSSNQNKNFAKTSIRNSNKNNVMSQSQTNMQSRTTNINRVQQPSTTIGSITQTRSTLSSLLEDEDEQLREFSEDLLKRDVNNAAKYVTINYQGKTTSRSSKDEAPLPLLSIKREAYDIPSIAKLLELHDNYIIESHINEYVSAQEKMEENELLDLFLSTKVMQYTRNFLIEKGAISKDPQEFKDTLREMWFSTYSRGKGKIGSSGFEHVFLAELKQDDVSGLHNWLYFHDAEAKKQANYLGYLRKFEFGNNKGALISHHFTLNGKDKPVGSMFIGTSPELEFALYSTCFLLRPNEICPLRLAEHNFIIRTYTFRYRGKNMIGSAFPQI